jgi:fumarate hydratase class II
MPGKVNPVLCESVIQVCAHVTGNDVAVRMGGQWGQLDLNTMLPVMAHNVLESIRLLASVSRVFVDHCLDATTANEETATGYVERSISMATALNPLIGYDKAAKIAKKAYEGGTTLRAAAKELGYLTDEEFDAWVIPAQMTGPTES